MPSLLLRLLSLFARLGGRGRWRWRRLDVASIADIATSTAITVIVVAILQYPMDLLQELINMEACFANQRLALGGGRADAAPPVACRRMSFDQIRPFLLGYQGGLFRHGKLGPACSMLPPDRIDLLGRRRPVGERVHPPGDSQPHEVAAFVQPGSLLFRQYPLDQAICPVSFLGSMCDIIAAMRRGSGGGGRHVKTQVPRRIQEAHMATKLALAPRAM